jgi:hypothetical protein
MSLREVRFLLNTEPRRLVLCGQMPVLGRGSAAMEAQPAGSAVVAFDCDKEPFEPRSDASDRHARRRVRISEPNVSPTWGTRNGLAVPKQKRATTGSGWGWHHQIGPLAFHPLFLQIFR